MRAITITEPGGPEALVWAYVPDPEPGPGEVVVEGRASAVNRADLLQRQGHYPPPPGASAYPGLECSGTVRALGPGVTGWSVGQEVCALLAGGGYAEQVAVPAGQLLPVPAGVDLVDAAALPEVACTVWSNVVDLARLAEGDTLLVHGGGSGIGTFAIQLGVALGATVVVGVTATTGGPAGTVRTSVGVSGVGRVTAGAGDAGGFGDGSRCSLVGSTNGMTVSGLIGPPAKLAPTMTV